MLSALRSALFLDRDGTLIVDTGYPRDWRQVELLPDVARVLRELQLRGYLLVLVSNQSGVGRGLISSQEARAVHERLMLLLLEQGVYLDAVYYCPHRPDEGCADRKPAPGMLLRAASALPIDLRRSVMIGDKLTDIQAGQAAGCRTALVDLLGETSVNTAVVPDAHIAHWPEMLEWITGHEAGCERS